MPQSMVLPTETTPT